MRKSALALALDSATGDAWDAVPAAADALSDGFAALARDSSSSGGDAAVANGNGERGKRSVECLLEAHRLVAAELARAPVAGTALAAPALSQAIAEEIARTRAYNERQRLAAESAQTRFAALRSRLTELFAAPDEREIADATAAAAAAAVNTGDVAASVGTASHVRVLRRACVASEVAVGTLARLSSVAVAAASQALFLSGSRGGRHFRHAQQQRQAGTRRPRRDGDDAGGAGSGDDDQNGAAGPGENGALGVDAALGAATATVGSTEATLPFELALLGVPVGAAAALVSEAQRQRAVSAAARRRAVVSAAMRRDVRRRVAREVLPALRAQTRALADDVEAMTRAAKPRQ
jgi:hypothetical protein